MGQHQTARRVELVTSRTGRAPLPSGSDQDSARCSDEELHAGPGCSVRSYGSPRTATPALERSLQPCSARSAGRSAHPTTGAGSASSLIVGVSPHRSTRLGVRRTELPGHRGVNNLPAPPLRDTLTMFFRTIIRLPRRLRAPPPPKAWDGLSGFFSSSISCYHVRLFLCW
jgi:hypothetical protein